MPPLTCGPLGEENEGPESVYVIWHTHMDIHAPYPWVRKRPHISARSRSHVSAVLYRARKCKLHSPVAGPLQGDPALWRAAVPELH